MNRFTALCTALDQTTRTSVKTATLASYFTEAPDEDRLWTIALLSGRRPKRTVTTPQLRLWAAEAANLPHWLFEESYAIAGDLAETIALVLPPPDRSEDRSLTQCITLIKSLAARDEQAKRAAILSTWNSLPPDQRFVFNKLITGGFRMGVSAKLMTRALSAATGIAEPELAHRLMGKWTPETTTYAALLHSNAPGADLSRPYPFYLAHGLDDPTPLGPVTDWFAERKWDGIRAQLIFRGGQHHLWSRGEELITDRFPEFAGAVDHVPRGTVLDGELLGWAGKAPLPFQALQKRTTRKTVPKKLLAEAPVVLMAYDLLEHRSTDIRQRPFAERRALLSDLIAALPPDTPLMLSPEVPLATWAAAAAERARSRDLGTGGLMLKRRAAPYLAGRKHGDWWKWKVDPLTIDAVMIYAQAGHGRRATLFTDYTFALWDGPDLVPFTKAYPGLTDAEFSQITAWVRKNTLQRFGPVRQVPPFHVFEIAFEGIQPSPRHKFGIALRFPRMLRWRQDKPAAEANTLDDLKALLVSHG